uniref:BolA-like protein n=1 Tax=Megaselia scalaris TaxID=36166 RepID=T1GUB1_MEGSC
MATEEKPIETAILKVLKEKLQPKHLEVINESYMHNVPKGAETHFKVYIVADEFESMTLIKRHRLVNGILKEALDWKFPHALSIDAKSTSQWDPNYATEKSPNCKGGFGK